jgi:hypothetical protein
MQAERMRTVFLHIVPRKLATLLALPMLLAAAPLCEACPANTAAAIQAPRVSHSSKHACCEKKPQVKQAHAAEQCDHCLAKPAAPNNSSEVKADFGFSPVSQSALPDATLAVLPNSHGHTAFFCTHSPPALYLVQQKILL